VDTAATFFSRIFRELKSSGFMLESDPKLPSVATIITGAPLRGSWWSHPLAQEIFQVNEKLDDHKDVLITKLISRKVTFVHRSLWSQLMAIGSEREPWQLKKLPQAAASLLKQVDAAGSVTTAKLVWPLRFDMKLGDAARELENRLLIVGTQFHTESGVHAKLLETWEHWAERVVFEPGSISIAEAKENLEGRLSKLNSEFHAAAKLPWQ
jgi:hypothetical protein